MVKYNIFVQTKHAHFCEDSKVLPSFRVEEPSSSDWELFVPIRDASQVAREVLSGVSEVIAQRQTGIESEHS